MVHVPAGAFWMGSDRAEREFAYTISSTAVRAAKWFDAELPRHRVIFLVTQGQYASFVAATGHRPPGISKEAYLRQGFLVHDYDREVTPYLWRDGRPPSGRLDHPVVLVNALDAEAFCRWRHPALRLPSEAEWEKAARGDDGRAFPWGNQWDPDRLNSAERGPGGTSPIARYPAGTSPYGRYDAGGNVFQWTASALGDGRRVVFLLLAVFWLEADLIVSPEAAPAARRPFFRLTGGRPPPLR
jgi:formylglycine-generating enzyme required for sulfatase activity